MSTKLKILIVDPDKKSTPYLVQDLTETYGFEVTWLSKADNVIETLQSSDFDAVILEIIMPIPENWDREDSRRADQGLDTGIVLLEKIRQQYPKLPIVVTTSTIRPIKEDDFTTNLLTPALIHTIVEEIKKLIG